MEQPEAIAPLTGVDGHPTSISTCEPASSRWTPYTWGKATGPRAVWSRPKVRTLAAVSGTSSPLSGIASRAKLMAPSAALVS